MKKWSAEDSDPCASVFQIQLLPQIEWWWWSKTTRPFIHYLAMRKYAHLITDNNLQIRHGFSDDYPGIQSITRSDFDLILRVTIILMAIALKILGR